MRKVLSILFLVAVMAGAMADYGLPTCFQPGTDLSTGWYNFVDGLNCSSTTTGSYDVSGQSVDASDLENMGATGLTKLYALHYQDSSGNRGLAYLFKNDTSGYYYAVFQYNEKVWGIPYLSRNIINDSIYYSNNVEGVIFDNYTALKMANTELWISGTQHSKSVITYLQIGDDSFNVKTYWEAAPGSGSNYAFTTTAGYNTATSGDYNPGGAAVYQTHLYITNATTLSSTNSFDFGRFPSSGGVIVTTDKTLEYDYYNCRTLAGVVQFSVYSGSDVCGTSDIIPDVTCSINGKTYDIAGSSNTIHTYNSTVPIYTKTNNNYCDDADLTRINPFYFAPDFDVLNSHTPQYFFTAYKKSTEPGATYVGIDHISDENGNYNNVNGFCDVWNGAGADEITQQHLGDIWMIPYSSPTGSMNDIDINSVTFDFSVSDVGRSTPHEFAGVILGHIKYWTTFIYGYNTTHYKACFGAMATDLNTNDFTCYGPFNYTEMLNWAAVHDETTGTNGTVHSKEQFIEKFFNASTYNNYAASVKKECSNLLNGGCAIDQFQAWFFDVMPGSGSIYTSEPLYKLENFFLEYNSSEYAISIQRTDSLPYGCYSYVCSFNQSEYYDANNESSGRICIAHDIEPVNIILQRIRDLYLDIYLTDQGAPVGSAFCSPDGYAPAGTKQDSYGSYCNITGINPNSVVDVSVSYAGNTYNGRFQIGDYYNSQQYGSKEIPGWDYCASFNGYYYYSMPLDSTTPVCEVHVYGDTDELENAEVYWDGEYIGKTNEIGLIKVFSTWDYIDHNLTAMHTGFKTVSQTQRIEDCPAYVYLKSYSNYSGGGLPGSVVISSTTSQTYSGMLSIFSIPLFLGLFLAITAGLIAVKRYGIPGFAGGFGGMALVMSLVGIIPWAYTGVIIFFVVILGVAGLKNLIGGNG